jgi:glycosyltransferase involved in cell wall biosynthesis
MTAPRVSVIIPCYNLGRYLDEAVDSVLAQSFQDFDILVVDDGSTDPETCRLLADYRKPRTRILRAENRGLPGAKNLGVAHTTGPYVCALDADDRADPMLLERSVAALDEDPSLAFISHWLRTFGDETKDWTPASCDLPALLDMNTVNGAALVRRSAFDAVGGFDETMRDGCEDWDLWITLVERGFKGRILPEVLYYYRRRADSMSKLMVRGDGHLRLYRFLAQKHADSYRRHLSALLVRREEDICSLRRHVHDLELEYYQWMAPEIAKQRDDAAVRERKIARDRTHLEAALEMARARAAALDAALDHARGDSDALRQSMSWRITAPLRAVYERLLSLTGSRREP